MSRTNLAIFAAGSLAGAVTALVLAAVFGSLVALGTVDAISGGPQFIASAGSMWTLTLVLGMVGASALGGVVYALGRAASPEAPRFRFRTVLPAVAVTGAALAYLAMRIAVGGFGEISGGVATISIPGGVTAVLAAGLLAGGVVAVLTDTLARPATLGFEAAPTSPGEVVGAAARAVAIPVVAASVLAGGAYGLSRLLLSGHGSAPVILATVLSALTLGGATLLATRPWDRGSPEA